MTSGNPLGIVLLGSVALIVGGLLFFADMVARDAALVLATAFIPLGMAGMVWQGATGWARTLGKLLAVALLSKLILVTGAAVGLAVLAHAHLAGGRVRGHVGGGDGSAAGRAGANGAFAARTRRPTGYRPRRGRPRLRRPTGSEGRGYRVDDLGRPVTAAAEETRYEYGPRAKRGYAGMSVPQVVVLLLAAVVALGMLNVVGGLVGLPVAVGVAALGGLLTFTRHAGLALPEWLPVLWQRARGERRWTIDLASEARLPVWPKALGNVASRGTADAPYLHDGAPVGLLDITAPAAFTLASSFSRTAATSGFAATLAGLAEPGGLVEAVSWTVRVGPADPYALDSWAAEHTDTAAHPQLAASYAELLAEAGPVGQHHTHTLAVRLRNGRETVYAKRLAGGLGPLVAREVERLAVQLVLQP